MNELTLKNHSTCGQILAALADPTRRTIYEALSHGPLLVSDIAKVVPVSRPAVSQHLKVLKAAGLVQKVQQERNAAYHALSKPLSQLSAYLKQLGDACATRTTAPAAIAEDDIDLAMADWAQVGLKHEPETVAMIARLFLLSAQMDRLYGESTATHGLSVGESMILGTLRRTDKLGAGRTPSDIARVQLISRPNITKRLARLEKTGMIRRQADAIDQRSHRVLLTPEGEAAIDAITNEQFGHNYQPFFHLLPEQRSAMNIILRHLLQALKQP